MRHVARGLPVLLCVLVVGLVFATGATVVTAQGGEVIVNPDQTEGDVDSIQEAVDQAQDHDTIRVAEGVYEESVYIPDTLEGITIEPEDPGDSVLLDGDDTHAVAFSVEAQDTTISDIGITSYTDVGVQLYAADDESLGDVTLQHLVVEDTPQAIAMATGEDATVGDVVLEEIAVSDGGDIEVGTGPEATVSSISLDAIGVDETDASVTVGLGSDAMVGDISLNEVAINDGDGDVVVSTAPGADVGWIGFEDVGIHEGDGDISLFLGEHTSVDTDVEFDDVGIESGDGDILIGTGPEVDVGNVLIADLGIDAGHGDISIELGDHSSIDGLDLFTVGIADGNGDITVRTGAEVELDALSVYDLGIENGAGDLTLETGPAAELTEITIEQAGVSGGDGNVTVATGAESAIDWIWLEEIGIENGDGDVSFSLGAESDVDSITAERIAVQSGAGDLSIEQGPAATVNTFSLQEVGIEDGHGDMWITAHSAAEIGDLSLGEIAVIDGHGTLGIEVGQGADIGQLIADEVGISGGDGDLVVRTHDDVDVTAMILSNLGIDDGDGDIDVQVGAANDVQTLELELIGIDSGAGDVFLRTNDDTSIGTFDVGEVGIDDGDGSIQFVTGQDVHITDLTLDELGIQHGDGDVIVRSGDRAAIDDMSVAQVGTQDGAGDVRVTIGQEAVVGALSLDTVGIDATSTGSIHVDVGADAEVTSLALDEVGIEDGGGDIVVSTGDRAAVDALTLEEVGVEAGGGSIVVDLGTMAAVGSTTLADVGILDGGGDIVVMPGEQSTLGSVSLNVVGVEAGGGDVVIHPADAASIDTVLLEEVGVEDGGDVSINSGPDVTIGTLSLEEVGIQSGGGDVSVRTGTNATIDQLELVEVGVMDGGGDILVRPGPDATISTMSLSEVGIDDGGGSVLVHSADDVTIDTVELAAIGVFDGGGDIELRLGDRAEVGSIALETAGIEAGDGDIRFRTGHDSTIDDLTIESLGIDEAAEGQIDLQVDEDAEVGSISFDRVGVIESTAQTGLIVHLGPAASVDSLSMNNTLTEENDHGVQVRLSADAELGTASFERMAMRSNQIGFMFFAEDDAVAGDVTFEEFLVKDNAVHGTVIGADTEASIEDVSMNTAVFQDSGHAGLLVDVDDDGALGELSIREAMLRDNDHAGLLVGSDTPADAIRVERSVITRNAAYGIHNENPDAVVDARSNWWGDSTGASSPDPASPLADPVTGIEATGSGDTVTEGADTGVANVRFTPAIGGKVEVRDEFVDVIAEAEDRTDVPEVDFELEGQQIAVEVEGDVFQVNVDGERISGPASHFVGVSVWERSILPLRADTDDATLTVDLPDIVVETDEGDAHINRQHAAVYDIGEEVTLDFESTTVANVDQFDEQDVQVHVVHAATDESLEEILDADAADQLDERTAHGINETTGDVQLTSDNVSVVEIQNHTLSADGTLTTTFTPEMSGDFAVLLTANETGDGLTSENDGLQANLFDDTVSVLGVEYVGVQETESSVTPDAASVEPGESVNFTADSNLAGDEIAHGILAFNEAEFSDLFVRVEDAEAADLGSGSPVFSVVGTIDGEPFELTIQISDDGEVDVIDDTLDEDVLEAIDASGAQVVGDAVEEIELEVGEHADLDPGESASYTFVHAAVDTENLTARSTDRGEIAVVDETRLLNVTVEDEDGDPLEDAEVSVENGVDVSNMTDADGLTTFELPDGDYTVTGEKDGYEDASTDVTIDGEDENITLTLAEEDDRDPPTPRPPTPPADEFDLTVLVTDQFGEAIEDATVDINGESLTTDADGEATITLEADTYHVHATKDGYLAPPGIASERVTLNEDRTVELGLIQRGPPAHAAVHHIDDNRASAAINVTAGTPVIIDLPAFALGADRGVAFDEFNLTAIADINETVDFEQSEHPPANVSDPPAHAGGQAFLALDYAANLSEDVDEVVFGTTVSHDRLQADDRTPEEVTFFRHNGTDWQELDVELVEENDDTVRYRVESPGLSVYTMSYEDEDFEIVETSVEPTAVEVGEAAEITGVVRNIGNETASYTANVTVGDEQIDTQTADVEPNETATFTTTHTFDAVGEYEVRFNGLLVGTVTVTEEHDVTVLVQDGVGEPLEGADVTIDGEEATTGEDGTATFELEDGEYTVTAELDGYTDDSTTVTVDGEETDATLTLHELHTLTVDVTDEDGDAIADATVAVDDQEATTDDDGSVSFALPDGEYTVTAEQDGYEDAEADVTIDGDDESVSLTLAAVTDLHTLTVEVQDQDGEPLADATVSVDGEQVTTDADGIATVELEDGEYTVTAEKDGYEEASTDVTIDGEDESVSLTLEAVADLHTLTVEVQDQDGEPLADATVSVDGEQVTTDADGIATVELEDGEYTVTAEKDGYEEASTDVTIDGDDESVTLALDAEPDRLMPGWLVWLIAVIIIAAIAAGAAYYWLVYRESV